MTDPRVTVIHKVLEEKFNNDAPDYWPDTEQWAKDIVEALDEEDPRECKGRNSNICVGSGCFNEECRDG